VASIAVLRDVLALFNVNTLSNTYITECGIQEFNTVHPNHQCLLWLGSFSQFHGRQISLLWAEYRKSQAVSDNSHSVKTETRTGTTTNENDIRRNSTTETIENNFQTLSRQVESIAADISKMRLSANQDPMNTTGRFPENPHVQPHTRYSSIGSIANIPDRNRPNEKSNVGGLIKSFTHLSSQFTGSGSIDEHLGTFHQNFANLCRTFRLTKIEAYENLYILFKTNSEAGRYYHKHVLPNARSLDEALSLMYVRFMSEERRDRLLQKWNNLNFSDFMTESGNRHVGLRRMCSMASSIQQQLGASYQDDQPLRDTLLSA